MKKMIVLASMIFLSLIVGSLVSAEDYGEYSKGIIIIRAVDNVTVEELNDLVALHNLTWAKGSPITTYGPLRGYVIVLEGEEQSWIEIFENESIIKYGSLSPIVRLACSSNNLELCSNKTSCESVEGFWYDNKCNEEQQDSSQTGCKSLYWFDNENKNCSQKQFCGTYMYLGLQTFASKTQCLKALNETDETFCEKDEDCRYFGYAEGCFTPEYVAKVQEKAKKEGMKIGEAKRPWRENVSCICKNNKCEEGITLSNGRKAEIKIMPETASERAIERLGELGFTIELKEVGKSDDAKAVYELTAEKQGKFLGIFKIIAKVSAQVDAETGEVVKVKKPWWSFLASGI